MRTGDPERLLGQLRDLRAGCLSALGRAADDLQSAIPTQPTTAPEARAHPPTSSVIDAARESAARMPLAMAWLPAEEYAAWPERWPDLAGSALLGDDQGGGSATHAAYCRRMERRLRELWEAGVPRLLVAPLRAAEFTQWVADNDPEERDAAQLRARYAADLGRDPARVIAWPPGRNEPCWCGSGRKYKKCCAAPGPEGQR